MRSAPNAGETEKHLNGTEREVSPQPIFGVKDEQAGLPKRVSAATKKLRFSTTRWDNRLTSFIRSVDAHPSPHF